MGIDKGAILQNAQKYTAKGLIDKAIGEWQKLIKESPHDGNIYNTIGDLYLKKNSAAEATTAFLKAAESFDQAGFSLKSIAVYKKIIKIAPKRYDVYLKLGDVNAERGLIGNAVDDYLKVAKHYVSEGKVKEGVEVYRKIARLDPNNLSVRVKLAEMCVKAGLKSEAVEEYFGVAQECQKKDRQEDAIKLCDQILSMDPDHGGTKNLKNRLLGLPVEEIETSQEPASDAGAQTIREETSQGECAPQEPKGVSSEKIDSGLGVEEEVSLQASQPEVSKEEGAESTGPTEPPAQKSDDPEIESMPLTHDFEPELEDPSVTPQSLEDTPAEILQEGMGSFSESSGSHRREQVGKKAETTGSEKAEADPRSSASDASFESVQNNFAEAEVYLKYGLTQKAIDQYKQILKVEPYNEQAHYQLKEIYKNEGKVPEAVMECVRLAKIFEMEGEQEKYSQIVQEALDLDPNHRQVKLLAGIPGEESVEGHVANAVEPEESFENLVSESPRSGSDRKGVEVFDTGSGSSEEVKSLDEIMNPSSLSEDDIGERLAEGEFYLQQGLKEEAKKNYELILSVNPDHPEAKKRLTELSIEEEIDREISMVPDPEMVEELSVREFEKSDSISESPGESGEVREEEPEHSEFDAFASDIEELSKPEIKSARESQASEEKEEGYVDLSDVLMDDIEEEPESEEVPETDPVKLEFDTIFQEFQKGIQEQFGDEDYETHYNLGIAYKEMGLINEAIAEFKLSVNGSERFIDSCSMLSACLVEKGAPELAAKQLENALKDTRCKDKNALWLKFELGSIYENAGAPKKALRLFEEVKAVDKNFKNIEEKIHSLKWSVNHPGAPLEPVGNTSAGTSQAKGAPSPTGKNDGVKEKKKGKISYL